MKRLLPHSHVNPFLFCLFAMLVDISTCPPFLKSYDWFDNNGTWSYGPAIAFLFIFLQIFCYQLYCCFFNSKIEHFRKLQQEKMHKKLGMSPRSISHVTESLASGNFPPPGVVCRICWGLQRGFPVREGGARSLHFRYVPSSPVTSFVQGCSAQRSSMGWTMQPSSLLTWSTFLSGNVLAPKIFILNLEMILGGKVTIGFCRPDVLPRVFDCSHRADNGQ